LADGHSTRTGTDDGGRGTLSGEAREVLGAILILERDNVHLEKPRIRKELTELIKQYVR
jgi:hypothetical protein